MKVSEWIQRFPGHIVTIQPESSLEEAVDQMLSGPGVHDIYVVTGEGFVLGHLSHKRLACLLLAEHRPVHTRRQIMERVVAGSAAKLMEGEYVFARINEEIDGVLHRFIEHDLQDMPVLDDRGILAGGINLNTILREIRKRPTAIFD